MDFTRVRNITGGTIKKLELNLSRAEGHSTEQKLQGTKRKVTYPVNLHMKRKKCSTCGLHICTSHHWRYYY